MHRLLLTGLIAASVAAPALAHPKAVSSTPAANATVAPTNRVEVAFTEKLVAQFAGASLEMTDMPGMRNHAPMKMKIATSVGPDGKTLVAVTPKPLPKGGYTLKYHVVSADTHRVEGELAFRIQ